MHPPSRPSAKEIAHRIHASRTPPVRPPRPVKEVSSAPVGYLRGASAAAAYCGIDRKTFRSWRDDDVQPEQLKKLLQPRIIRGESYYKISNIDRFMDPANNDPDAITRGGHLLAA